MCLSPLPPPPLPFRQNCKKVRNQKCTKSNWPQTETKATGHHLKYVQPKSKDTGHFVRCITDRYFKACIFGTRCATFRGGGKGGGGRDLAFDTYTCTNVLYVFWMINWNSWLGYYCYTINIGLLKNLNVKQQENSQMLRLSNTNTLLVLLKLVLYSSMLSLYIHLNFKS